MPDPAQPVLTVQVLGRPVRFFPSPLEGPDFCWHAVDDLYTALPLPRAGRDDLLAGLHRNWRNAIRTVDAGGERLVIGPHWMAQALISVIGALVPDDGAAEKAYTDAAMAAAEAMLAHLSMSARLSWMMEAAKRHVGDDVDG